MWLVRNLTLINVEPRSAAACVCNQHPGSVRDLVPTGGPNLLLCRCLRRVDGVLKRVMLSSPHSGRPQPTRYTDWALKGNHLWFLWVDSNTSLSLRGQKRKDYVRRETMKIINKLLLYYNSKSLNSWCKQRIQMLCDCCLEAGSVCNYNQWRHETRKLHIFNPQSYGYHGTLNQGVALNHNGIIKERGRKGSQMCSFLCTVDWTGCSTPGSASRTRNNSDLVLSAEGIQSSEMRLLMSWSMFTDIS